MALITIANQGVKLTNQSGEVFTFPDGFVNDVRIPIVCGIDKINMPASGPASNQGNDIDGTEKNITIQGKLMDTTSSVTSVNDIRSKYIMKLWLESIATGTQTILSFSTYTNQYSVQGSGSTTVVDPISSATVTLPATFVATKGYVINLEFGEEEGNVEYIPFSMTVYVAGL